jgi:deoxyribonuclease V
MTDMADLEKLKAEQEKLAKKVIAHDAFEEDDIRTVAGIDQAYTSDNRIISAIVVLDFRTLKQVEAAHAVARISFPYIPGFLSYRELPSMMEAYTSLENRPDMIMVDGNGILHPRRIGLASHLGVLLDTVTIGVAKNLLLGDVKDNRIIIDKEVRGYSLVTKEHANPIYVSPGHKISLQTSVSIARRMIIQPHKLPEPIHLAHKMANRLKKELSPKGTSDEGKPSSQEKPSSGSEPAPE